MQACQGRSFRREQDEGLLRSERSFHPYVRFLESRIKRPCADHSGRVQKERRGDPRQGSSNRKPPYSLAGGLFDTLKESNGDFFKVTNDDIVYWMLQFFNKEGYDIFPAAASAVAALRKALDEGTVKKDETVMLNITGAGMLNATSKGFELKKPDLILSTELSAEEVIASVDRLF